MFSQRQSLQISGGTVSVSTLKGPKVGSLSLSACVCLSLSSESHLYLVLHILILQNKLYFPLKSWISPFSLICASCFKVNCDGML